MRLKDRKTVLSHLYCTVRFVLPLTPFNLALMVHVPPEAVLAIPAEVIVATAALEELQVAW